MDKIFSFFDRVYRDYRGNRGNREIKKVKNNYLSVVRSLIISLGLDRRQKPRAEQVDGYWGGGGQQSCSHWADK